MRRIIITFVIGLLVLAGLGGVAIAAGGGSAITKPRLERSVGASFSNVYAEEAALLGHSGVTPGTLHARTMCDKGPGIPQSGPGTNWNCLISWQDPNTPMPPAGYGKIEVTVHSNGCYTAGAPSTLVGYQTITSASGRTVSNPAYEWDGCLDPDGSDAPTGVKFPPALSVTDTTAQVDKAGHVAVGVACAVGPGHCVGTVVATADGRRIGSVPVDLTEQATKQVPVPGTVPADAKEVTYTLQMTQGVAAKDENTVPVQR